MICLCNENGKLRPVHVYFRIEVVVGVSDHDVKSVKKLNIGNGRGSDLRLVVICKRRI